jgi:curli production assembly/transport component CsgG
VELIIISLQVLKRQLLVSTPATTLLKDLPKPKEPIVVGSINSEIKRAEASENGSNFSTAVTQGATHIN